MSVKITTNQNNVTVADADKSITIINNREPNRIDIVQPESDVIYVAALGPQGIQGIQGPQGEVGLTITDLFVYRGNDTWSTTGSLQISSSLVVSQSITGLSGFTGSLLGTASWAHSASQALTASYVNPLRQNVIITGSIYIPDNNHAIYFSGSQTASRLTWNNDDGTLQLGLKGGFVQSELGQGLVTRVVNKTSPLVDLASGSYQVVVIGGAQGQRLSVKLAQADNDANSAGTLGVVAEDIARNQEGYVITVGLLKNRNTTGNLQGENWNDGDILYLSPTVAGRMTNVKPQAPQHTVIIGYVEYAHQNNGKIYVKVDNGYEIDELHNIRITTASLNPGQLLVRSGSNNSGLWINTNQLTGSYGLTGSLTATSLTSSLFGTASWAYSASRATTASYILSSNVSGPNGFDSVNYASSAGSADAIADPLTQDLQIKGLLSNLILLSDLDNIVATVTTSTGNVVEGTPGTGLSIGSLCYLDYNTPAWELVDQTTNSATKLLAVCTDDSAGYFLLDGKITLDSSYIGGTLLVGAPIYLSGSGQFTANVASLTTGYVRLVGHLLHRSGANYILNFRPDHTWIEL